MSDKNTDAEPIDFSVSVMDDCYLRSPPPPDMPSQRRKPAAKRKGPAEK